MQIKDSEMQTNVEQFTGRSYSSDRAIKTSMDDLLGRAPFADHLAHALYENPDGDGYVIGLFGQWGTGKTSVINMMLEKLEELSGDDANKPLIVKFSPWNFANKNDLITLFFAYLKNKIGKKDTLKGIGKILEKYSSACNLLQLIPVAGLALAPTVEGAVNNIGQMLGQESDLNEEKEALEKALIDAHQKIIVIIDDIDRLTNTQIRDVFQLVKQVADFPNIIYVLSMDKDVVVHALEGVNGYDGNKYLEKIVQVPFTIPELSVYSVHKIFEDAFETVLKKYGISFDSHSEYWNIIKRNCIYPYLHTLRDVNRMINVFQFKIGFLSREICVEDVAALITIEIFDPGLYRWIADHKAIMCGWEIPGLARQAYTINDFGKEYADQFKKYKVTTDSPMQCIAALSPAFDHIMSKGHSRHSWMRFGQSDRFDSYFLFDLTYIPIPEKLINDCIYTHNEIQLSDELDEISSQGHIQYFLDELSYCLGTISIDRLKVLVKVLYKKRPQLKDVVDTPVFGFAVSDQTEKVIESIISKMRKVDSSAEWQLFEEIIVSEDLVGIRSISDDLIDRIATRDYVSSTEEISDYNKRIQHLDELGKVYAKTMEKMSETVDLPRIRDFSTFLYIWQYYDPISAGKYAEQYFKKPEKLLKYVCTVLGYEEKRLYISDEPKRWVVEDPVLKLYIDPKGFIKSIEEYGYSTLLEEFTDEEQLRLACMYLYYKNDSPDDILEDDGKKLVDQWKQEASSKK